MIGEQILDWCQYDQIGRFLKVLDNNVSIKRSPNECVIFWASVKSNFFHVKLGNFPPNLGKF